MRLVSYIALGLVLENVFTALWNLTEEETAELPSNLILMEILPRLPTKLLGRCIGYKLLQIDHSNYSQLLTLRMIDCEAPNVDSDTVFIWNKDLEHLFSKYGVYIVAGYDGLMCLAEMYTQELEFWNPLTSAFKKLSERLSLLEGGTWRMYGNNGWLKVMAFSNLEDDSKVRRLVCMTRNENWLAIGQWNIEFSLAQVHVCK
nr:F-box domain-containing protein [Tanacetum cinerariifolium]